MNDKGVSWQELIGMAVSLITVLVGAVWWLASMASTTNKHEQNIDEIKHEIEHHSQKIDTLEDDTARMKGKLGL